MILIIILPSSSRGSLVPPFINSRGIGAECLASSTLPGATSSHHLGNSECNVSLSYGLLSFSQPLPPFEVEATLEPEEVPPTWHFCL